MDWINRDSAEWGLAWKWLAEILPACGISADFNAGEGWQYMGSEGGAHTFRNRNVTTPEGERRVYATVGNKREVRICPEPGVVHTPPQSVYGVAPSKDAAMRNLIRRPAYVPPVEGRDWICSGNFDGNSCGSDADSGL